jgi:PTS system N-acetylgalactosamine-specific IIA component
MTATHVLLVTHPGLGEGLLQAAEAILKEPPRVTLLSNRDLTPDELEAEMRRWLAERRGIRLILTDLPFGSCCQAAKLVAKGDPEVGIVAGVNLPVLLAALRSREHASLPELLRHLAQRGAGAVEIIS